LQDLEEVAALGILDGRESPVIDDEDVEAGQPGEQADVRAVSPGQGEFVEETRGPTVAGAIALATGLVGERAREEAFPDAGRPDQDHVVVFLDPAAGGELADDGLVELAAGRIVDGFEACLRGLRSEEHTSELQSRSDLV